MTEGRKFWTIADHNKLIEAARSAKTYQEVFKAFPQRSRNAVKKKMDRLRADNVTLPDFRRVSYEKMVGRRYGSRTVTAVVCEERKTRGRNDYLHRLQMTCSCGDVGYLRVDRWNSGQKMTCRSCAIKGHNRRKSWVQNITAPGGKIGFWTVKSFHRRTKNYRSIYEVQCGRCGSVRRDALSNMRVRVCPCWAKDGVKPYFIPAQLDQPAVSGFSIFHPSSTKDA